MQINYYINGQEVNRPLNFAELSIELNYDKDSQNQATSLTEFEFGLGDQTDGADAANLINAHLEAGLFFEGLPFRIDLTNNGTTYILFDGYLDVSSALFDCDKVVIQAKEKKGIDYINDVFDSKSFQYIFEVENLITPNDFVNVPYVLTTVPNNVEAFLVLISTVFIIDTITTQVKHVQELTAGFTAFPVDAGTLVQLGLATAYTITLVVLLIKTIKQMIDLMIQPVKYHSCMSTLRHCQVGAQSFGYTFSSTILESEIWRNEYILPEKYNQQLDEDNNNNVEVLGNTNPNLKFEGFYKGTFGDLLRELKKKFNAKLIVDGNILRLERLDYNNAVSNYVIPPIDDTNFTLNADELKSNYVIEYQTDINDKHTIQNYEGTVTQVITNSILGRTDYTSLKGLENVSLQFARANQKLKLTYAEKTIRTFLSLFDAQINFYILLVNAFLLVIETLIKVVNTILTFITFGLYSASAPDIPRLNYSNLAGLISERIGMLKMENDFVDTPKMMILIVSPTNALNTKLNPIDRTFNNSLFLWQNYHYINSFVPTNDRPNANQYKIYEIDDTHFCFDDYELVKNSKYIEDDLGRLGEIISLKWNPESETASINYKVNELYSNKLTEQIITPDGQ